MIVTQAGRGKLDTFYKQDSFRKSCGLQDN
jgi:hypothetical protein